MRHWLALAAVVAQQPPHASHPNTSHGGLPTVEPATVSWQGTGFGAGRWDLSVHGFAVFGGTAASDGRGERDRFATSMVGFTATRPVGKGALTLRLRISAEPVMGPRGYPELLQTGESADGLYPLRDRQHPHDFLSELGLAYRTTLPDQLIGFGYLAAVGEPGFGPASFMHRGSARALPEPPLGHHLQDAIHVSHGVARVGIVSNEFLTLEASAFNGRESDQKRWAPDQIRLDSYAFRALGNVGQHWAIQGSVAYLSQPERTHPTINQTLVSVSASHARSLAGGRWQTTAAFGRALSQRRVISLADAQALFPAPILAHYVSLADFTNQPLDSLFLVFPSRSMSSWVLESSLEVGRSAVSARAERATKHELFDPTDLRHSEIFSVVKLSLGYLWELPVADVLRLGLGGVGSLHLVPDRLQAVYGKAPRSGQLFVRLGLGVH